MDPSLQAAVDAARRLRRHLHQTPERSGHEARTAESLAAFFAEHGIPVETGIGGHGVLARLGAPPYRLLRADMDALPAPDGARHGCGHDGHMAMLAGALVALADDPPPHGVLALFQPSEEDGSGMARCLAEDRISEVSAAFAVHNVPGHSLGAVIVGPGALASTGLRITLTGREAHAASPEEGRNPYPELRELADAVPGLADGLGPHALATLIHVRLGEEAYGTSPGTGVVAATLRGSDEDVTTMRSRWTARARHGLHTAIEDVDPFPATENSAEGNDAWRAAAKEAGLPVVEQDRPFPWSEDFGHAVARFGGALVGLGSGTDQPPLHDDAYGFPETLVRHGVALWTALGRLP